MAKTDQEKVSRQAIEYVRIVEGHRTKRLQWVVGGVVVCVLAMTFLLFKVLDRPWWQSLIVTLVAAAIPNTIPCYVTIKVFRNYVRRKNVRIKELEGKLDGNRTSSGLNADGTPKP